MRHKKLKRHRKIVRYFTTCFGFRKPYKVLCDGTFVHHLLVNRILPADQTVSNTLGGPVKLFTTRCVLAELRRLGQSHSQTHDAARNLMIASCGHEKAVAADACFAEVIGQTNPDHFFVATQDSDLRKDLQKIPGVPTMYGLRTALHVDPISASQREFVKKIEKQRSHMTELERSLLRKKTKNSSTSKDDDSQDDENEDLVELGGKKTRDDRNRLAGMDRVQFKRKKAKAPNPLSCKKKKTQTKNLSAASSDKNSEGDSEKSRRKRKRLRNKKQSMQSES